jgi:hypothetical protein
VNVARYREKDETDLRWNSIRRRITRQLDTEISDFREVVLNKLLTGAWMEYSKSLESGEALRLESHVADWVADALAEALGPKLDSLDVAAMPNAPGQ